MSALVRRVLLVDDEPDILETLGEALPVFLGEPLEVRVAVSAEEARDLLLAERFDAVITDEKMPGIQGTKLLEWIRHEHPLVVRVLMTAYSAPALRAVAVDSAHLFVSKPIDLARFAADLRQLFSEPLARDRRRPLP